MKPVFSLIFLLAMTVLQAQRPTAPVEKNALLNPSFWTESTDVAAIKSAVVMGNDPAELNRMSMDPVVFGINANAPVASILYLLSFKGNDPNKLTHDSRTYIFWAANKGNTAVMEYLLSKGAKVNIQDSHGYTPLNFAANNGQTNTKVYDLLLAHGADLKKDLTHDGANALLLVVARDKDFALTDYFVSKGLSLSSTDNDGNTAFNYAARTGNMELMNALIKKGVKYNDNAMIMASQSGGRGSNANTVEVYQYLEGLGIKPNAINANGENALHYIVRKPNQAPVISYFISKGVDVNKKDNEGNTPFMTAAATNRDLATIELLLPYVKDINHTNNKGVSALAMCLERNAPEIVKYLIGKGADVRVKDAGGNNLAAYLVESYDPRRGGLSEFDTKHALLQENGFDVTQPQQNGNTLYHLAIAKNDLALLKRIESMQVDVNAKNQEGLTVLHKAAMTAKNDDILKYLLSIGAKKDISTEFKETAYDLASENELLTKNNISIDFLK